MRPRDDDHAFARFGLDDPPKLVRESANAVFEGTREGARVFVRLTTLDHRVQGEIEAEVAWMSALADAGVRVVRPLPSRAGKLVEPATWRSEPALAICTACAPGRPARKPDDYTPAVVTSWAELLADLHAHARATKPHAHGGRRAWDGDRVFLVAREATAPAVRSAIDALAELVAWLRAEPRDEARFGLTHADLHLGNLSVDDEHGGRVTAFDFDDACVHFYAHDVAVAVTSIRKAGWERPGTFDAAAAEACFLEAYARATGSPPPALEPFVAYRIALSACWASRAGELGLLDDDLRAWYVRSLPWWLAELERLRPRYMQQLSR